jgi:lipoyl(octanoyl) transferase
MEEALIRLCAGYGVLTGRIAGRTGVWTNAPGGPAGGLSQNVGQEKKIAAIGVHVSRGITSHGFAFNLSTDLRDFQWIVPCGIADREVTSLEREIPDSGRLPTLEQLANAAARHFGHVFDQQILALEDGGAGLKALRDSAAGNQPTIGVPMQVPAEVERLVHRPDASSKPVRA